MKWLVTGGAGYIGAHVVRALQQSQVDVVVYDDLSTGRASTIPPDVPLVQASVLDTCRLRKALIEHAVGGIIHLAAKKAPAESVAAPLFYFRENVQGMVSLLEAMRSSEVPRIVLSSSSSVYGNTDAELVRENAACSPESPYGQTKLICEWLLAASASAYDISYVALRYFNVAGAGHRDLADRGANNLIPIVFRALRTGRSPQVYGTDYPTPDGSCIRDYVHVVDVASAHAAAARKLENEPFRAVYNVGTGRGTSVIGALQVIGDVTGIAFEPEFTKRRPGDPARVVGDVTRIADELGWRASHDLRAMVASAWTRGEEES